MRDIVKYMQDLSRLTKVSMLVTESVGVGLALCSWHVDSVYKYILS